ncbi:GNAT family acetyltransferase [Salmonella enterica subsp. enterica serovar Choleraesuis]|nr:GNAT family acetyltransferase [Salmonella enterica subsp. enterica serovar Choleraesuis]
MTILSERLQLRPVSAVDIGDVWRIYGDARTHSFNPKGPLSSYQGAEALLQEWMNGWQLDGFGEFAIALKSAPQETIGFGGIKLRHYEGKIHYNLGYRLAPEAWGKGYASEFTQRVLWFGFTALRLSRVTTVVRPAHAASRRVLEKNGLRCTASVNDVPGADPSLFYEITLQEWRSGPQENA